MIISIPIPKCGISKAKADNVCINEVCDSTAFFCRQCKG